MTATDRRLGVSGSAAFKLPCRVATTANITLSGLQTIDGVTVVADDRVLVKNQTTASENGIYVADTSTWQRAIDFNGPRDCVEGTLVLVANGTVGGNAIYELTTTSPVIGTSSLTFLPTAAGALALASAFMLTVLDDTTAAAARATLDVPSNSEAILDSLLTARGDAIRRSATVPERVPLGQTGQSLGSDGTDLTYINPSAMCGRLTLATGVPILDADDTANTSVFFTPFRGNLALVWNSTLSKFVAREFSELTNVLADTTTGKAGPAAAASAKVYTMLVWDDAGTIRLTRSPAWTSDTDPGTGAGTAQTSYVQGVEVNTVAITNGPGAGAGTVVGWIMTNTADANVKFLKGGTAANGSEAWIGLTNKYNRVPVGKLIGDTTNNYTYSTATWRAANASNTMRVTIVNGGDYCPFKATYSASVSTAVAGSVGAAVGKDSTSAPGGVPAVMLLSGTNLAQTVSVFTDDAKGKHFYQALEIGTAAGTTTWYGDNGAAYQSSGLIYEWEF